MAPIVQARLRALTVAGAPVLLLIGFVMRPYLSNPRDAAVNADAVIGASTRWIAGHLVVGLGLVLTILSILAIRFWLASIGEFLWSFVSVAFVALGVAGLLFVVGYDGIGGWAVNDSGGFVEEFFDSGSTLEGPIFIASALLLGVGLIALATAVVRGKALTRPAGFAVIAGVVVAIAVPSVAVGWAVYVQSIAAGVASWPIAWKIWQEAGGVPARR